MTISKNALVAGLLLATAPVLAQSPPPSPSPPSAGSVPAPRGFGRDRQGPMNYRSMFSSLSPAGQATMREAMRGNLAARQAEHDAVKAARDRMLTILDADRLDTGALKKAMADERAAANAGRDRMQASMAAGFAKLSLADRRAFVAEAKAMRARMEERMKDWRGRGGDGPPDPPPLL